MGKLWLRNTIAEIYRLPFFRIKYKAAMDLLPLFEFSLLEWIVLGGLILFFIVQLLFYILLFRKPYTYAAQYQSTDIPDEALPGISVVIASKNESENLAQNLPSILEQDYPNYEVIVVNSGSTDETDILLKGLEQKYPQLYHTYIPQEAETNNEKKLALSVGIKAAKNEILLFTEAYCRPVSNQWIRSFACEFAQGKEVVLGYCKLNISKKIPLRKFILYDNLVHSIKYLSMAIIHKPFMGIGRNMAYKKRLYLEQKGFATILNIEGGEDDLLINRIASSKNTGVILSPESMTESDVVDNFHTWRQLKSKYLYTKKFYKTSRASIFGLETFSKYMFYLLVIASIVMGLLFQDYLLLISGIILWIIRATVHNITIHKNSKLTNSGKFYLSALLFDIIQPLNNFRFKRYADRRNNYRHR
jgi:glycosyltransferase involved in cell wall biosynthesis